MVASTVAQETIVSLRRQIAAIEGRLADRLDAPEEAAGSEGTVIRANGMARPGGLFASGIKGLDQVLGGGLPLAALTEIHSTGTRDAASGAGFALALLSRVLRQASAPLLWIGTGEIFREAGFPYAPGLREQFGIAPEELLFASVAKPVDALWVAEEAAPLGALAAVLVELSGSFARLDLTATRRLHRRAQMAGRPVLLMRQAAQPEPTAAPVRLVVSPAPAAARQTMAGPMAESIGRPAFDIRVSKSRAAPEARFQVEWNADELNFEERQTPVSGAVVPLSQRGTDSAAAAWPVVACEPGEAGTADFQPAREKQPTDRGRRRTG
ncbi:MAG: ImuA family protein [Rhizobiaceae bacterium]